MGDKFTQLMCGYIDEHKELIANPKIQKHFPNLLPKFYDEPEKWKKYVFSLDENGLIEFTNQLVLFKYFFKMKSLRIFYRDKISRREHYEKFYANIETLKNFKESEQCKYIYKTPEYRQYLNHLGIEYDHGITPVVSL